MRISDYCSVTVRVRVKSSVRAGVMIMVRLVVGLRIVVYKLLENVS